MLGSNIDPYKNQSASVKKINLSNLPEKMTKIEKNKIKSKVTIFSPWKIKEDNEQSICSIDQINEVDSSILITDNKQQINIKSDKEQAKTRNADNFLGKTNIKSCTNFLSNTIIRSVSKQNQNPNLQGQEIQENTFISYKPSPVLPLSKENTILHPNTRSNLHKVTQKNSINELFYSYPEQYCIMINNNLIGKNNKKTALTTKNFNRQFVIVQDNNKRSQRCYQLYLRELQQKKNKLRKKKELMVKNFGEKPQLRKMKNRVNSEQQQQTAVIFNINGQDNENVCISNNVKIDSQKNQLPQGVPDDIPSQLLVNARIICSATHCFRSTSYKNPFQSTKRPNSKHLTFQDKKPFQNTPRSQSSYLVKNKLAQLRKTLLVEKKVKINYDDELLRGNFNTVSYEKNSKGMRKEGNQSLNVGVARDILGERKFNREGGLISQQQKTKKQNQLFSGKQNHNPKKHLKSPKQQISHEIFVSNKENCSKIPFKTMRKPRVQIPSKSRLKKHALMEVITLENKLNVLPFKTNPEKTSQRQRLL